jgi:hypothetical protein
MKYDISESYISKIDIYLIRNSGAINYKQGTRNNKILLAQTGKTF